MLSSMHLDDVTLEGIGGDTLHDLEVIMKDAEQMCLCLNNTNFVIICHDNMTRGIVDSGSASLIDVPLSNQDSCLWKSNNISKVRR